jgi:hypothetical protein
MPKSTNGRVRRSLAEWRTLCERFARRGLGQKEVLPARSERPGQFQGPRPAPSSSSRISLRVGRSSIAAALMA